MFCTCDQSALVGNIREVLIGPQPGTEVAQTLISDEDGRKFVKVLYFYIFYLVADLSTENLVRFLLNNLFRVF